MTEQECRADELLNVAKEATKRALGLINPNATEPTAQAILKAIDGIDTARKELANRFS